MAPTTAPGLGFGSNETSGESLPTWWGRLTRAERGVAELVAEGMSNAEIGQRLGISSRTVETHLSHMFRKVPPANRRELRLAIREGRSRAFAPGATADP